MLGEREHGKSKRVAVVLLQLVLLPRGAQHKPPLCTQHECLWVESCAGCGAKALRLRLRVSRALAMHVAATNRATAARRVHKQPAKSVLDSCPAHGHTAGCPRAHAEFIIYHISSTNNKPTICAKEVKTWSLVFGLWLGARSHTKELLVCVVSSCFSPRHFP